MGIFDFINFILSILELYLSFLIIDLFVPFSDPKGYYKIGFATILTTAALVTEFILGPSPLTTLVILGGMIVVCQILCEGTWIKKLGACISASLTVLVINMMIFSLVSMVGANVPSLIDQENSHVLSAMGVASRTMYVGVYLFLRDLIRKQNKIQDYIWKWIVMILLFSYVSVWIVFEGVAAGQVEHYFAFLVLEMFIVVDAVTIYLSLRVSKIMYENIEQKIALETMKYEEILIDEIQRKSDELRKVKHDFVSHVLAVRTMVMQKDFTAANSYLDRISIETESSVYVTSNRILNVHLAKFNEEAKKHNIDVKCTIVGDDLDYIQDVDMTILMSNLLNNAIEAAKNCNERRIDIRMNFQEDMGKILIRNSSNFVKIDHNGNIKTTKKDKVNHGYGISNIKQVISAYNGIITNKYDNGEFIQYCTVFRPV